MAAARIPDFEHIRRKVPIREIARDLGLAISGNMVHCWRLENHQHGDRTASVGLHNRKNTAKCFVCDSQYSGTASQSTISNALKRFQNLRALKKVRTDSERGFRSCSTFRWTLDDPTFLLKAEETRNAQQSEIELERALRAKLRNTRKAELLQVNTLSSEWSTDRLDATP